MANQWSLVFRIAVLYVTRMLGLFVILPVLVIIGDQYENANTSLIGWALGIYGLTQALMQIPMGWLSDRYGRIPILLAGFTIFLIGSLVAAYTDSIYGVIIGRALQGFGAVSAVLLATLSDYTSEDIRARAMAVIGISIGFSFALAMMIGPILATSFGLSGIFIFCAILSVCALIIVSGLPNDKSKRKMKKQCSSIVGIRRLLFNTQLLRLNIGIFTLHTVQMASWLLVPVILSETIGMPLKDHWWLYLTLMVASFICMSPLLRLLDKTQLQPLILRVAVLALTLSILLLVFASDSYLVFACLFLFFWAFNLLEAGLPSLVSKLVSTGVRGRAMGIYSTHQFLGAFVGGSLGGIILTVYNANTLLLLLAVLSCIWFLLVMTMGRLPNRDTLVFELSSDPSQQMTDNLRDVLGVVDVQCFLNSNQLHVVVDLDQISAETIQGIISKG